MQTSLLTFLLLLVLPGRKTANFTKSVVTLHPPWSRVLKNDLVTLRCEGPGASEDNSTLWFHNDTIIPVQIQDYNITADNITYSGEYQCQIGQLALSDPVRLEVFQDWLLLQTLKLVYMEGEPMVLRCHSWKNKVISKITFFQNDKGRKYSLHDSNFTINQVNYNDNGNYFCSANIGNRKHTSKVVNITVQGTPHPSTSTSSKIWYYILFYLVMGILFAMDTALYFILKTKVNSPKKNMRHLVTKWS
ncbi:low affinity immunoglobulin gamma Fc region receptor III-B-like [Sminthopsis crassicaudata]|uniref:low affinity immunoglobulin gamma Fc region receptor III-B-like n=1 Tax=Sminthopsis crassicaudata TaxID=9301 RepID=UPI003D68D78A